MPKKPSEKRQIKVLRYIYDTVQEKGYPPTVREICKAVELSSTSTVHGHLARLSQTRLSQKRPDQAACNGNYARRPGSHR